MNNFIRKIIAYENSEGDDYLKNSYMLGEWMGFGGDAEYATKDLEDVRLGTGEDSSATQGFLSNADRAMNPKTLYDSPKTKWSKSELINIMNSGVHILNHIGHSAIIYNMKLWNDDVDDKLSNDKYFIVYSHGCYSAAFDNKLDRKRNFLCDCIAEHLVVGPAGAVAYIGNSRYGWGSASPRYNREFWDALFNENIRELGKMNQDSKEDNVNFLDDYWKNRWCYFELNLLGDPAMVVHLPDDLILHATGYNCTKGKENKDNCFNSGEIEKELAVTIKALNQDASNVSVMLDSNDPYVTIEQNCVDCGGISKGESKSNSKVPFKFKVSPNCPVSPYEVEFTLLFNDTKRQRILVGPYIEQITTDTSVQCRSDISGDYIVWQDNRNGNNDVYLYDIRKCEERQITSDQGDQLNPAISGNYVVWEDWRNGDSDIYLYDILGNDDGQQITFDSEDQYGPAISGDNVVWKDYRGGDGDIYLYDIRGGKERQIMCGTREERLNPAISGNYVICEGRCNRSNSDIYLVPLDPIPPTNCSIKINKGAAYAISTPVALTLSAEGASKMQFSNDGSNWSKPEAYSCDKKWGLLIARSGDVDGSGYIVSYDALQASKCAVGRITLTPYESACVDVDGDGKVTKLDASNILKLSVTVHRPGLNPSWENQQRKKLGLPPIDYLSLSGASRVYAKFIDAAGNESVVSDTIILDMGGK